MSRAGTGLPTLASTLIAALLATACADPEASPSQDSPTQGGACADAQQREQQQLALTYQLVQTERQLQVIRDELRNAKDESFFAALERQQGVLRAEHADLVTKLDELVRASAGEGEISPLPPGCASVHACFALEP